MCLALKNHPIFNLLVQGNSAKLRRLNEEKDRRSRGVCGGRGPWEMTDAQEYQTTQESAEKGALVVSFIGN
jgi:hypothetical protein